MNKEIKPIDFLNGIKDRQINENFNIIQEQINNERRTVGGPGICDGFKATLSDFTLTISSGNLIAMNGAKIQIDETTIDIELPILIERKETLLTIDSYNRIKLAETPYALTRRTIASNVDLEDSGVKVVLSENNNHALSIAHIDGDYVILNDFEDKTRTVDVFYYVTYKRRDLVYIDRNYKVQIETGITSPSPSIPEIEEKDYLYKLGYVDVTGFKINELDQQPYAAAVFVKLFDYMRNLYTDENGDLYICGQLYDGLQTIYIDEPKNPKEWTFWYDFWSNELKVWRAADTNDFLATYKVMTSNPDFSNEFNSPVRYKVNQGQIRVYVNGTELDSSEIEEGSDLTELQKLDETLLSNKFKVLKTLIKGDTVSCKITRPDGYMEWIAVNNKSYIPVQERYIWSPEYLTELIETHNHDLKHFFFDYTANRNLIYTPNKNCLDIYVNQIPLHSDQFDEITINDALEGEDAAYIKKQLQRYYGYSSDIDQYLEEYENIGVGFAFKEPLDKAATLEVRVTHRVNSNPIAKRFQRSATFIDENSYVYTKYISGEYQEPIFKCKAPYRYQENQLEVYLNGIKLINGIDYIESESEDVDYGTTLYTFKIIRNIETGDRISYKITTNVFSYDHVDALFDAYHSTLDGVDERLDNFESSLSDMNAKIKEYTSEIRNDMEDIQNIETNLDSKYLKKDVLITKDNLSKDIYEGIACNPIYQILNVSDMYQSFDVTNICDDQDFVLIINVNNSNVLIKDLDYNFSEENKIVKLNLLNKDIQPGNQIYITGVRYFRKE